MQETPTGHEIPVPSREEVFRDLGKVAKGGRHRKSRKPAEAESPSDAGGSGPEEQ
jgi:hypothetical protein